MEKFDREPLEKELRQVEADLSQLGSNPEPTILTKLSKRHAELTGLLSDIDALGQLQSTIAETRQTASDGTDPELQALATQELTELTSKLTALDTDLNERLHPADPNDLKDVIVEIRAGAGGDEAGLFAAELFRMYARFAERQNWKTVLLSTNHTGIGGLKEGIFEIHGQRVYRLMKYESGVHRVQRVPETEKSGRVHTSTVTVAVVPIAEETDLVIDPKDLKIIASTSSGHGGQSVNTTYSAIRLTHIPTGITVSMQDERSQTQNKLKAMEILRSRLLAKEEEERRQKNSELRKSQIGSGDRSEKIRTYNIPQDRVTDHRVKMTLHGVVKVLDGNLLELLDELRRAEMAIRHDHTQ